MFLQFSSCASAETSRLRVSESVFAVAVERVNRASSWSLLFKEKAKM